MFDLVDPVNSYHFSPLFALPPKNKANQPVLSDISIRNIQGVVNRSQKYILLRGSKHSRRRDDDDDDDDDDDVSYFFKRRTSRPVIPSVAIDVKINWTMNGKLKDIVNPLTHRIMLIE